MNFKIKILKSNKCYGFEKNYFCTLGVQIRKKRVMDLKKNNKKVFPCSLLRAILSVKEIVIRDTEYNYVITFNS